MNPENTHKLNAGFNTRHAVDSFWFFNSIGPTKNT